ncbi:two-partner secretion domain-containing protein [Leptothoe sp. PORK10 BA2]|uniref:two-partner secretion domain-containing protein n=1 Tax=Leptothoe sp. PORK10 BA2 TaxID=3110254 RepID=UPI002B1EE374|nr:filamentous hemagglutinin N-terminal domain-containing protein [Leptothoe sp. PORK10 BA2]MEA5464416.1 filamentous hemagglutinin N-terminal domain-containing protein [Leptothoe sp. PORK10 BA2]
MSDKQYLCRAWIASNIIGCMLLFPKVALGQVLPDSTTGTTLTSGTESCLPSCTIGGGISTPTNPNLFHSFDQFSVSTDGIVIFEHSPTIQNIVARVTGANASIIDGRIRTSSTNNNANLFLINPEGITIGPRGGLDIGGSFVATTADAIQFGGQGLFSAIDTTSNPALLTVNPSAFLFTQDAPQPIVNQSIARNPVNPFLTDGLKVKEGKSLILLGGNVILERDPTNSSRRLPLRAPGGQIALGGVSSSSVVGLDINGDTLSLSYADDASLADISINDTNINLSDISSGRAGKITINANSLSLNRSDIESNTSGVENAGTIVIRADDSVTIQNGSTIASFSAGPGSGGSIEIIAGDISLISGNLSVTTRGTGNAGQIFLDAETISLDRSTNASDLGSSIRSDADSFGEAVGNVGEIQIQTNILSLNGGSTISILTRGEAVNLESSGALTIEAQDSVSLSGESSISSETFGQANASNIEITTAALFVDDSVISAAVNEEGSADSDATGQGGIITIDTQLLSLENNAQLTSSTSGAGDGGAILINNADLVSLSDSFISAETSAAGAGGDIDIGTVQLTADAGSRISATATTTADAATQSGDVMINATQINLSGENTGLLAETQGDAAAGLIALGATDNGAILTIRFQEGAEISAATSGSGTGGQILVTAPESVILSGDGSLSSRSTGSGPAGDVFLQTDGLLRVQDGARVEVSGNSTGDSGTLEVTSAIAILKGGQLLASTQAGEEGNIDLNIANVLLLRGDSLISAEAFNDANGGNVDITAPFIIALFADGPNGNDIQASAQAGNGGLITIQTNALFNLAENIAVQGNMTNDLDASSGTGINGEVIITNLQVDPIQGTNTLAAAPSSPEIAQGCQASGNGTSQFIASGRSGVAPGPYDSLSSPGLQDDIYPPGQTVSQQADVAPPDTSHQAAAVSPQTMTEAQGWRRNAQGEIVLVAEPLADQSLCQRISAPGIS